MKKILSGSIYTFKFLFVIYLTNISAQVSQQWVSNYNSPTNGMDAPVAMIVDNSGNIFVTGVSPTSTTSTDFATVKYNSAGVEQWSARYHNPAGAGDQVRGIALDASGNVFVTGSVAFGGSSGVQITVKYNPAGIQQWAEQLGEPVASPAAPGIYKSPIATDGSGNVYVGGIRKFGGGDNGGMLLIKYNSNGDSLWTRRYKGTQFLQGLGSAISCIKVEGNFIYVTGKTFDMNPNVTYATTIKYNSGGGLEWMRMDTLINGSDDVVGMETDASGNLIVTCNHGFNILTFKYNSAGARLWKKSYIGIGGNFYDIVTGLAVDQSENIYLTGTSVRTTGGGGEDFLTLKYDGAGNLLWEKFYDGTYGDGDYSKGISVDLQGSAYITGITFDTNFNFNYMTIKYDTDGTQMWKIKYDGGFTNRRDEPVAIVLDSDDNVIVTGISSRGVNTDDYTTIKYSQTVGINQISYQTPAGFSLSQNYPNPFNPSTNLEFAISESGFVSLKIYNNLGKEIATLVNENLKSGLYKYEYDAAGLTSGIYFYKLETNNFSATKKMLLIK